MRATTFPSAATVLLAAVTAAVALSACGKSNSPTPTPTATVTRGASSASASTSASAAAATPPGIVAVTKAGSLVALNPATGAASQTLVSGHVLGDEISVSGTGMAYFAVKHGCSSEIEAIPVAGGTVTSLAVGSLPAVSPDGTKLAYASEPSLTSGCVSASPDVASQYHVAIRTLRSARADFALVLGTGQRPPGRFDRLA